MELYYHKTDGGAEYLTDTFIECQDGHKEGAFRGAKYIVRIDGDITKDAELTVRDEAEATCGLDIEIARAEAGIEGKIMKTLEQGMCPECGENLEYGDTNKSGGDDVGYVAECKECGWTGTEWYVLAFAGFTDKNGDAVQGLIEA